MDRYEKTDENIVIKRLPMNVNIHLLMDYWSKHIQDWRADADDLKLFAKDAIDNMWLYAAYQDDVCTGVLVNEEKADSSAMWLLHVSEEFRRQGFGSSLFSAALKHIGRKWTAGLGTGYWWQGVPVGFGDEFLDKRGFQWTWTSIDMIMSLDEWTCPGEANTPASNTSVQNAANTNSVNISTLQPHETDALIQMLKEEMDLAGWTQFYEEMIDNRKFDNILAAHSGNHLIGCAMVLEERDIRWGKELGGKVGGIGCIGVKDEYRGQGIGTALVSAVNERLKSSGYSFSYVGYTWLEDWYGAMGYQVYKRFRMGERNTPSQL